MLVLCQYPDLFLSHRRIFFHIRHRFNCMRPNRKIFNPLAAFLFIALVSFTTKSFAAEGEALFKANCANCHKITENFTGPALQGARKREPNPGWAYKWVNNVNSMLETDPYAKSLLAKFGGARMTQFNLKEDEIKAILDYADSYKPPVTVDGGSKTKPEEDNSLLFGILTLILAVIALTLLQVNSS